jgi:hypothetical protein
MGITEAGANYTAWALSELPAWMLSGTPGQAACLAWDTGDVIGWVDTDCAGPGRAGNPPGELVPLMTAARGQVSLEGSTALLVHPMGAVNVAVPRRRADGFGFRCEALGCYAVTRAELGGLLVLWPAADGHDDEQQLNLPGTALARQLGFAQRSIRGPVMLCRADGGAGGKMTIRQLVELLTWPLPVPRQIGGELAAAGLAADSR